MLLSLKKISLKEENFFLLRIKIEEKTKSKPTKSLPASWVSSCKSQGKRRRTGNRVAKISGKTQKVAGKKIKGKKYGGPLPDYSA